ncbi:MAG: cell envelope integrity protein CreD [Spirochaetaceae bacterium]|jgi:inner membrane protein|nr:cell envelope integrity protein CreD [Spirochaetaceae bacterium]
MMDDKDKTPVDTQVQVEDSPLDTPLNPTAALAPAPGISLKEKFTRGYTFKVLVLAALLLLLLIPLGMLQTLVRDRSRTAQRAEADIMEAWGKQLEAAGPVMVIPGIRTEENRRKEEGKETIEISEKPFNLVITPEKLDIKADFTTEIRRRGIFSVPLFYGDFALSGTFNPRRAMAECAANERLLLEQAELVIALSSQKGIRKITEQSWNGQELFFRPGSRSLYLLDNNGGKGELPGAGIYALLPPVTPEETPFRIGISIQGGQAVQVVPVGQDTHLEIAADWGSPSFQGAFLPVQSTITDSSFAAQWNVSYLSRDIPLFWKQSDFSPGYRGSLFGVSFFRAIDTYALNTRAVKYAILFLIVPFFTLFLLEIFTKRPIHPVPYILSGIANIIFYLLLLSISEQFSFYGAYTIAAASVTALLTLYSRSLLPSWSKSWYMGLVLLISYILLYAVLNAESYALLIGSIGAFIVTALVMFLTRKLDWYGSGTTEHQ